MNSSVCSIGFTKENKNASGSNVDDQSATVMASGRTLRTSASVLVDQAGMDDRSLLAANSNGRLEELGFPHANSSSRLVASKDGNNKDGNTNYGIVGAESCAIPNSCNVDLVFPKSSCSFASKDGNSKDGNKKDGNTNYGIVGAESCAIPNSCNTEVGFPKTSCHMQENGVPLDESSTTMEQLAAQIKDLTAKLGGKTGAPSSQRSHIQSQSRGRRSQYRVSCEWCKLAWWG